MITPLVYDALHHPVIVNGFSIILKATIILLVARIALLLLRGRSATERHYLLVATFIGLLVVPMLHFTLPPITPQWLPTSAVATVAERPSAGGTAGTITVNRTAVIPMNSSMRTPPRFPSPWIAVLAIWIGGALATFLPVLLSLVHRRALLSMSPRIRSPEWTGLAETLSEALGIRSPVRLIRADDGVVPLTWGVRRPVILLPAIADEWNVECRRAVVHHELAHVRRGDARVLLSARTICALYWFHPFAWRALRDLRIEQELAADELVLSSGSSRLDYATGLLEVARQIGLQHRSLAYTAALSPGNFFEHRLRAIIGGATHKPASAITRSAFAIAGVAMCLTVGAVQPAAQGIPPENSQQQTQPARTFSGPDDGHFRINWPTPNGEGTITLVGKITFGATLDDYRLSPGGSVIIEEREGNRIARRAELRSVPNGVVLRTLSAGQMAPTRTMDQWVSQMLGYLALSLDLREKGKGLEKARAEMDARGGLLPGKLDAVARSRRLVDLNGIDRRRIALTERRQALEKRGQSPLDLLQIDLDLLSLNLEELSVAGYASRRERR